MSSRQTDNKNLDAKIRIRNHFLPENKHITVLDAYCGQGIIWDTIKQNNPDITFSITGIDLKDIPKRVYLKGDNCKFLQTLNLDKFDIIDLDAYGFPFKQLEILFDRGYKGIVFITSAGTIGRLPDEMNMLLGYTKKMLQKIPSLFYRNKYMKIRQYLALRGITHFDFTEHKGNHYIHARFDG